MYVYYTKRSEVSVTRFDYNDYIDNIWNEKMKIYIQATGYLM